MKTFNMYVKAIITDEYGQALILREKRMDNKTRWDLPGTLLTDEQSFDEVVISNIQKEIGYYVYPGKIIGTTSYKEHGTKSLYVIMEGSILNGELLLSENYENSTWVDITRIKEYPLTPWLNNYVKNTKYPFNDVIIEIEEMNDKELMKQEIIQENRANNRKNENKKTSKKDSSKSTKGSFGLLKETIIKTFHPREVKVTKTKPKNNLFSKNEKNEKEDIDKEKDIINKLNVKLDDKKEVELDDITIEHENKNNNNIPTHNKVENNLDEEIIITNDNDIVSEAIMNPKNQKIEEEIDIDMDYQNNITKVEEPEIKIISKEDKVPLIRKEKEANEKISFNSEGIKRRGWKERLSKINRTNTNNQKKKIPHPKGKKRN